jgi:hypothetical protein
MLATKYNAAANATKQTDFIAFPVRVTPHLPLGNRTDRAKMRLRERRFYGLPSAPHSAQNEAAVTEHLLTAPPSSSLRQH